MVGLNSGPVRAVIRTPVVCLRTKPHRFYLSVPQHRPIGSIVTNKEGNSPSRFPLEFLMASDARLDYSACLATFPAAQIAPALTIPSLHLVAILRPSETDSAFTVIAFVVGPLDPVGAGDKPAAGPRRLLFRRLPAA